MTSIQPLIEQIEQPSNNTGKDPSITPHLIEVTVNDLNDENVHRKGLCAVLPAYNEELVIGTVVLRTKPYVDRVIVVDDGSSDRTAEVAKLAGAEVIQLEHTLGKTYAILLGLRRARETRYPARNASPAPTVLSTFTSSRPTAAENAFPRVTSTPPFRPRFTAISPTSAKSEQAACTIAAGEDVSCPTNSPNSSSLGAMMSESAVTADRSAVPEVSTATTAPRVVSPLMISVNSLGE